MIVRILSKRYFQTRRKEIKEIRCDKFINWARIMCQITYYFYAASRISDIENVVFSVPTGNFWDILAGYISKKMGLNFRKLIIGTNENNILDRTLKTGEHAVKDVIAHHLRALIFRYLVILKD